MCSMSATEVPPNFITRRAIAGIVALRQTGGIHSGGFGGSQLDPGEAVRPTSQDWCCLRARWARFGKPVRSNAIVSGPLAGTLGLGMPPATTVDDDEVARFSALADEWWDPRGKMAPLHKLNPVRRRYIRDLVCRHVARNAKALDCLSGLRLLDIGCGAGILSEPLARIGCQVVAVDPSAANIAAAKLHAKENEVAVDYRTGTAEALADAGESFDVVLAMEVVEHVADVNLFVRRCADMVRPGGLMVVATINRTLKSFALAIVGAEYVLGWLPRGTHRWDKLVTPNELEIALELAGLRLIDKRGVIYDLFGDCWRLAHDTDVNYMLTAKRPEA